MSFDAVESYPVRRRLLLSRADDASDLWLPFERNVERRNTASPSKPRKTNWQRPELIRGSDVRKVRTRGKTGYTADVPMTRLRRKIISAENMLQADFILVTDAQDNDVEGVISQPLKLDIFVDGHRQRWIPDYMIKRQAGPRELVDVKFLILVRPADQKARQKVLQQFEACEIAANKAGYVYRLVTEQEIRIEPMLYNARLIHRHSGPFGDQALLLKALMAVAKLGSNSSIAELGSAVRRPEAAIELAIRLDRLGHIRLDRSFRFNRLAHFALT